MKNILLNSALFWALVILSIVAAGCAWMYPGAAWHQLLVPVTQAFNRLSQYI